LIQQKDTEHKKGAMFFQSSAIMYIFTTSSSRPRGFTLVEIVVVLAIIGILMGLSAMALSTYLPYSNLKRAARTIISLCQMARSEAVKRNTHVAVVFNPSNQTCAVYTEDGPDNNWNTEDDNEMLRSFSLSELQGGIDFGYGAATKTVSGASISNSTSPLPPNGRFVFNPRGGITGSLGTVYLQDRTGATMAVTVRSFSGAMLVRQWQGTQWTP
jgi:type IV fimbrial biogenesis protein FimT